MSIIKIILVGPESTGKTTLCKILSEKYNTQWVKEACRTMAEEKTVVIDPKIDGKNINFNFTLENFIEMANRQNEEEYNLTKISKNLLICDNDSFAISIWCERYLGKFYNEIYDIYKNATNLDNQNKIYILTKPNVPFVQDGLRDGEHIREWMFERFLEELQNKNLKYYVLDSPDYVKRTQKAIEIIENILLNL